MPDEKDSAPRMDTAGGSKLSDRLQAVSIVVSLAALALAIFATLSANDATSKADQLAAKANQLAASVASAHLVLASPLTAHIAPGTSAYQVSLNLTNQGGGSAQSVKAWVGTLDDIQYVTFVGSCPQPIRSYAFYFPLGKALGVNDRLAGTANVPAVALPPGDMPTNSMVLYVSWQDNDGSTQTNCVDLSNTSTIGDITVPRT
jgi:hypothetical protein